MQQQIDIEKYEKKAERFAFDIAIYNRNVKSLKLCSKNQSLWDLKSKVTAEKEKIVTRIVRIFPEFDTSILATFNDELFEDKDVGLIETNVDMIKLYLLDSVSK